MSCGNNTTRRSEERLTCDKSCWEKPRRGHCRGRSTPETPGNAEPALLRVSGTSRSARRGIPALGNVRGILAVFPAWAKMKETKLGIIGISF